MIKASLLSRVAAAVAAVALLLAAPARAVAATSGVESTPVDLTGASDAGAKHIGGGGSIVRTIVGLAIVIGVIYGVAWVLRQVKASRAPRATGSGLATLASVPLGSGRSVNLVRAGNDLVLLGVAEQGVVPIRTYTQEEAHAAGLVDEDGMLILPADDAGRDRTRAARRLPRLALPSVARLQLPRPQLALPAPRGSAKPTAGDGGSSSPTRTAAASPAAGTVLDTLRAWTVRS